MCTISRVNNFGFVGFAVLDNTDTEIVRFDTYCDAVEFISFLEGIKYEYL